MKEIKIIGLGDCIISHKLSVHTEPEFLEMADLVKSADLTVANLETLIHDYEEDVYPSPQPGGSWMRTSSELADEMLWLGIDMVSTANNHSLDYMYGGLFKTIYHLNRLKIKYAGTGKNLSDARKPAYVDTAGGRIGLISASSTNAPFCVAGPARRDMNGRPGLNPLRYQEYYTSDEQIISQLKEIYNKLGLKHDEEGERFFEKIFTIGEPLGRTTQPDPSDMAGNLESIREALRQSDLVIFSLHCHQGRENEFDKPATFVEEFARACIDEGAHLFLGHGPHVLMGIELRNGKPIFYSLGNFIYQNFSAERIPAEFYAKFSLDPYSGTPSDAYDERQKRHPAFIGEDSYKRWISVFPRMTFKDEKLTDLQLYPVYLGQDKPRSQRGRPLLAKGALAEKILKEIKALSLEYGTEIVIKDGIGKVIL